MNKATKSRLRRLSRSVCSLRSIAFAAAAICVVPVIAHGQIFVAKSATDSGGNSIGVMSEYTTSGALVSGTLATSGSNSTFGALALSGSNLFAVSAGYIYPYQTAIGKYTTAGASVNASLVTGLVSPKGLAVSPNGASLYVADMVYGALDGSGTVAKYNAATGAAESPSPLITGLIYPVGIAVSGANIFVLTGGSEYLSGSGTTGTISEYTTSGALVNPSLVSGLKYPQSIAVSGTTLFVTCNDTAVPGFSSIHKYTTSGDTVNASLVNVSLAGAIAVSGSDLFVVSGPAVDEFTTSGVPVDGPGGPGSPLLNGFNVSGLAVVSAPTGYTSPNAPAFGSPQPISTAHHADNIVMGDFDGDGTPDVAVLDATSGYVSVHFGDGAGGFKTTVGSFTITSSNNSYRGIAAADLDGDGTWELIFATGSSVQIYDRQSDGSFAQTRLNASPWTPIDLSASGINATKVAVGDLTAAGSRDIVVSDNFGAVGVVWIPNDGTGNFGAPAAFPAKGCSTYSRPILVDVDGDGLADVVLNGGVDNKVRVLLNNGDGTLSTATSYGNTSLPSNFVAMAATVGDIDGDGLPDLVQTGYVTNLTTFDHTYYLSVNINNGNGTFADGQASVFNLNNGVNIGANAIEAADFTGSGQIGVVTPFDNPTNASTGFIVTQWSGIGASFTVARQDSFLGDHNFYSSIAIGCQKNDGSFATFNNDPLADVILGISSDIIDTTTHSEFVVFDNSSSSTPPPGRDVSFAKSNYEVTEGGALDVTVTRGAASTGQVLAPFSVAGTAIQSGLNVKNADYTITDPPNQSQTVTFGTNDYSKTIHIVTNNVKGSTPDKTILLTLLEPWGDTELGSGTTATVTIHSTVPSTLGKPGALSVKPANTSKPTPHGVQALGRTGADWNFSVSQPLPANAFNPVVKVQTSILPPSANQWTDFITLTHGKGSSWTGSNRYPPLGTQLYFRTVTSAAGYPDRVGAPTQAFGVLPGPELALNLVETSESDAGVPLTTHTGEVLTCHFIINNVSPDAAATNAVLAVPIPKHTKFKDGTDMGSLTLLKDKKGNVTSVSWKFGSIAAKGTTTEDLRVTVDNSTAFAKPDPANGIGYIIVEKGFNLSAADEGVKSAANLVTEFDAEILGAIKFSVSADHSSVNPGGLITYTLNCENDSAQPIANAIVFDEIPDGTDLAAVYSFDANGNADITSQPLQNPGPLTNPGIIYKRTSLTTNNTAYLQNFPALVQPLVALFLTTKAGLEFDVAKLNLSSLDQNTLNILTTGVNTLINDGFLTPSKIKWTIPSIPAKGGGKSNVSTVAFTVRVPYDASAFDSKGNQVVIANGHYDKTKNPPTYLNDHSSYDFIFPGTNNSALYGHPPQEIDVAINNVQPAEQPHLMLGKCARGDQNLNNPDFHGSGFSTLPYIGDVVNVAANHGVDYQLIYRNDLDGNGNGADAHGVILHDVIPEGMELRGFFTQNVNGSGNGPMFASQFTFYDKNGVIIPGIDPNTNQDNMALVRSMDIRLGDVSSITVVPKGTYGFVEYTCAPTITPQTVLTFPGHSFDISAGVVHSFGGFQPGQGLSSKLQGFYISTTDQLTPVPGWPDDCVVQVVADVSWNFPPPTISVNDSQPFDVTPVDFHFTQNGDVSAPNTVIKFSVPPGVTFLNSSSFVPPQNAVVTKSGTSHPVADGSTSFDCRPIFTDDNSIVPATQTGTNVQLSLGTVNGHTSRAVRVFFQVNGPALDSALKKAGSFHPINPHIVGTYVPSPKTMAFTKQSVIQNVTGSPSQQADAPASGINPQKVHDLNPPLLGISRTHPYSVQKGSQFTYTINVTNHGDSSATNVVVGMQIPWRTTFVSTDNGQLALTSNGVVTPTLNSVAYTTKPRSASQVKGTGPGPDIVTWHVAALPAQSSVKIKLVVQCDPRFADEAIEDHSAYVFADNVGLVHIAADPVTVWIFDTDLNDSKIQAAQAFLQNQGITVTPGLDTAVALLAQTMTGQSQVHSFGGLDVLQMVSSGVKIIPLGKGQVLLVSEANGGIVAQGAGNIVAQGAGNVVSNDGGSIVAQGAGNAISVITGVAALGTQTAEYLLNNIPSIVAQGAGNIVAAGAGNLVSHDGGSLISNQPGGGIIAPISQLAGGITYSGDGGRALLQSGGSAVAAGVVSNDGGSLISQDGGGLISQDGSGLTLVHTGVVSNDGGSLIPPSGR